MKSMSARAARLGSAITPVLELGVTWLTVAGLVGGVAGAWALLSGRSSDEIATEVAVATAAGFVIGFFVTIAAAILLLALG